MADTITNVGTIEASVNYTIRTDEKPVSETYGPGPGGLMRRTKGMFDRQSVSIHDARPRRETFGLETAGFELVDHPTAMRNFFDPEELKAVYYPEMERLIAERSGAKRVFMVAIVIFTLGSLLCAQAQGLGGEQEPARGPRTERVGHLDGCIDTYFLIG
mgnify:CR=1 FL=1